MSIKTNKIFLTRINVDLDSHQIKADESICRLISPEDLKHATRLTTNYFEPSLWRELTQNNAYWHHKFLLEGKITPGHLWVQKGLEGSIIHWSEGKTIHRASLFENQVLVVAYTVEKGIAHTAKTHMSTDAFKELIHAYLEKKSDVKPIQEVPQWDAFIKKLELMKITCSISQAASQKFIALDQAYPKERLGAYIHFQVRGKQEADNPLIEVSKRALTTCIKKTVRSSDALGVPHNIGSTLRSFEALEQALSQVKDGTPFSDGDRAVANLSGDNRPRSGNIQDFNPFLKIKTDDQLTAFPFKIRQEKRQTGEPKFVISIDYVDEKWILESTCYW